MSRHIQRRAAGPADGAGAVGAGGAEAVAAVAGASGAPLPEGARARFEASLGTDLGGVRVHDGAASQGAAAELGAHAFTVGRDIHFGAGQLQPDDPFGMHLLAHEVAHTVQQGGGGGVGVQAKLAVSQAGEAAEVEADRFADHVVGGGPMPALSAAPSMIQRQEATPDPGDGAAAGTAPPAAAAADPAAAHEAQVTAILDKLIADLQALPLKVPGAPVPGSTAPPPRIDITVSVPYWNKKYLKFNLDDAKAQGNNYQVPWPSQTYRDANGTGASNTYRRAELDDDYDPKQGTQGTGDAAVGAAKGTPGEIGELLQRAVDGEVIDPPDAAAIASAGRGPAWKQAIELWMARTGIGVDCNGFVYQALLEIHTQTGAPSSGHSVFDYTGALNADGTIDDVRTNVPVPLFGDYGAPVAEIDLAPGDTMTILGPDHVRIVLRVDERDRAAELIEFTTAESTVEGRASADDVANGPRLHRWRWHKGQLAHKYDGDTDWTPTTEDPSYRRHLSPPAGAGAGG